MKFYPSKRVSFAHALYKFLLVMKLIILFLTVTILQVSAESHAQRITLNIKNEPLVKIFNEIRNQSGYDFFYDLKLIKQTKPVTINVKNASIKEVLEKCFTSQPLTFKLEANAVMIKEKEKSVFDEVSDFFRSGNVKGHISDSTGNSLAGATIRLENNQLTAIVTQSDEYGDFTFTNVPQGDYKLTITYIGYETLERYVSLKDKNINLKMVMNAGLTRLKTVTVVNNGFQQISAERATGAFDNIPKNQLQKPATTIASRLIGTTAGMQVRVDADGHPTIELRGQTTLFANAGASIAAGNQPLLVVDGFPIQGTLDGFTTLNPNDVESISVLKDAAAASIWGARAANGVIVVTTKKGNNNTPLKIEFSAFTRVSPKQNVGYLSGLASPSETVDFEQFAFQKWGAPINTNSFSSNVFRETQASVYLNENKLGFLTSEQLNTALAQLKTQNNQSQVSDYLLSHPVNNQYNLSISGGGKNVNSFVSMLAEQDQSNFTGTHNNKYAINYRTNASVFKWLDAFISSTYQYEQYTSNGVGPFEIQQISPYQMLKNPDGSLTNIYQYYQPILDRFVPQSKFPYSFAYNPIQETAGQNRTTTYMAARLQAGLTFKILPGLTVTSRIQYENRNNTGKSYYSDQTFYLRNLVNTTSSWNQTLTGSVTPNLPLGGRLDQSVSTVQDYNFRNQANFSRTIADKHEFNIVAGTEIYSAVNQNSTSPTAYGYNDNTLTVGTFPNGPNGTTGWTGNGNFFSYTNSYSYGIQRFYSVFANAAYTYNSRYTLSGSYRTDASNLIASDPKYRYSPFYSVGLGYDVSKENFLKNVSWINRLNLRATYGYNGNVDPSTSPYALLNLRANPNVYTGNYTATISSTGNPTLTWEKTRTINFGFDYAVLNNHLFGKIDVYDKKGSNLLAAIAVPSVVGTTTTKFNNAGMDNRGIEVTLGTSIPIKSNAIVWNGSFNASYNKNHITSLFNTSYSARNIVLPGSTAAYVEGANSNAVWAYQYLGLVNGAPMFNGPGGVPYPLTSIPTNDARTFLNKIGTTDAPYNFGMTNSFRIYDFNFSFIATAKLGAIFRGQYFNYSRSGYTVFPNKKLADVLNGDPNTILTLPTAPNDITYGTWGNFFPYFSYNYLNSSLLRMQEVNLTYNIPQRWISRIRMHSAQVILQGNNLFTILANKTGEDPEYPIGTVKPLAQYTLGIKFEL